MLRKDLPKTSFLKMSSNLVKIFTVFCIATSLTFIQIADGTKIAQYPLGIPKPLPSLYRNYKQSAPLHPNHSHEVSSTSFTKINFGTSGSYNAYTEHPKHHNYGTYQTKSYSRQPRKTATLVPSQPNQLRNEGAVKSSGSQDHKQQSIQGGIDFSTAKRTPDGRLCVIKEKMVETVAKTPIMKCTMKNIEICPYTYNVEFKPTQEEICEENFESKCQITFNMEPSKDMVKKCNKPLQKVCDGQGEEKCITNYETHCSTKYIEKHKGKFVGDTKCEKLPIKMCGKGCSVVESKEQCRDEEVTTMVQAPNMDCDLSPRKQCHMITKMMPSLAPKPKCTIMPKETCHLEFSSPRIEMKPMKMEFCLDESPLKKGETYDDGNALAEPFGSV